MTTLMLASILAVSASDQPADVPELLAAADAAYRAGIAARADAAVARPHFEEAAAAYEAAWDRGRQTVAIARNMAQARYLAGDLGRAIRHYRRGLQAFPHDPDLRAGLAFVREQVEYPRTGDLADGARPRDTNTWLDRLPLSVVQLAGLILAVAALGWVVLARAWITARRGLALVGSALVLLAAGAGTWLWWYDGQRRARWAEPAAVVIRPGAELRTGNSAEYPRRLDVRLPAGTELGVLGERGGWRHVRLADGTVGWVPADRVVNVGPDA